MDRQKYKVGSSGFELPDVLVRSPQGSAAALHRPFVAATVPGAYFLAEILVMSPQFIFPIICKKNLDESIQKKKLCSLVNRSTAGTALVASIADSR